MVVRLKDLNNDSAPSTKKGLVRLSDMAASSPNARPVRPTRLEADPTPHINGPLEMDEAPPKMDINDELSAKARNIPVLGSILRGLDKFSTNPIVDKGADIARSFYIPGGSASNIAALTGIAERGVAKALPSLGNSALGRIGQKALSEGIVGAPLGVAQTQMVNPDATVKDLAEGAAWGLGGGAVLGGAAKALGETFQFAKNTANSLGRNAIQNVADNSRFINSPFSEGAALNNPVARGYTEEVGKTFGNVSRNAVPTASQTTPDITTSPGITFKTSKGSSYSVDANGRTQRTKTLHQGHDPNDTGLKSLSDDTVFVNKDDAARIGSHFGMNKESRPKIVYREDGIHLLSWNAKENRWGRNGPPIPYTKNPEVGRSPIEFWGFKDDPQLGRTASKVHAGNDITEIIHPNSAPLKQEPTVSKPVTPPLKPQPDSLKFTQTVRDSQHTAPELTAALNENPVVGARTSDVLNRKQAQELIDKHGAEGLYGKLMGKTKAFSASENTAAQILAKQFSSLGGDDNLSKAIDLVSKTAKGGREMGQAIQALSQWNKLDAEGALLVAERQLNKGVTDTADWKKLTVAQATPIKEAAQRIGSAQEAKSLADEVLSIVTNKQAGQALTDAEKATIKQFQDQVKLINEKGKGILSQPKVNNAKNKADKTIKEVSQIEPKKRTRDQVVSFMDAKAEKARQRLANSRNIGFSAVNKGNPVIDWSIIAASHIAKGVVKKADLLEQMLKDFGESVRPHIDEVFTKATNMFRKEQGLPTVEELDRVVNKAVKDSNLSPEDANRFKAWASEIGYMSDEFKVEATQDLQFAMKNLGESTLGNKLSTLETVGMLLNEITLERNIIGNAAQLVADKVSKVAAVPVDFALSKLTGEQRTIFFKTMNQSKFWKDFMTGTKSGWRGVSPTGTLDSYGVQANVFGEKNPLKYLTKSLGAALQGFDYAFYNQAKGEVLATYAENLGRAQGLSKAEIKNGMNELISQLDTRIHELADHAGLYATYQDETVLSKASEMLKHELNEVSTGKLSRKLVDMGMSKKLSMEGYGLGDIVNKFAKTPANLIMRGLDYSPIGFIRSAVDLGTLVLSKEKFNQHQAARTLGRAITGTLGLTGMGFILADAGILTGAASMDKDVRSIQEQSGQGAYKVNWSALKRFFLSKFDYNESKYQKGDIMMDYAWLQPAAISLSMGVNANKSWKDLKSGVDTNSVKLAGKAILGGMQSLLENPLLQGVNNLIDASTDIVKKQDPTKLKNIAKGIPARFVPTVLNQYRTATDNKQRETFSNSLLTEMGNLMKNKVPGLSNNLPVSYDSLGNEREKIQGGQENTVGQYLKAFFSPTKITEYQVSPEAKLALDLMNQSGDQNVLPRIADRYIKVAQGKNEKDLRMDLTAEQYSQLQRTLGKLVTEKLTSQSSYLSDPNKKLENKVQKVKDILTESGQKARDEIGTQMGYTKKNIR